MITFDNWQLASDGAVLAMQFDNKSRLLEVLGDLPQDWTWTMLVAVGQALDVISMDVVPGGLEAVLTAETLSLSGYYSMQLKGVRGDVVRHTNVIRVPVQNSLSGDAQWPTIPTEFTEIEQNILDLNQHPPYPGSNGYWMIWNTATGRYEESTLQTGSGGSDKTFNFSQNVPSAVWYVEHNLGKYPSVSVVDSGNNVVIGDVSYVDDNNLKIQFSSAFSGKAYMN